MRGAGSTDNEIEQLERELFQLILRRVTDQVADPTSPFSESVRAALREEVGQAVEARLAELNIHAPAEFSEAILAELRPELQAVVRGAGAFDDGRAQTVSVSGGRLASLPSWAQRPAQFVIRWRYEVSLALVIILVGAAFMIGEAWGRRSAPVPAPAARVETDEATPVAPRDRVADAAPPEAEPRQTPPKAAPARRAAPPAPRTQAAAAAPPAPASTPAPPSETSVTVEGQAN